MVAVITRVAPEVRFVSGAGEHDLGRGAEDDGEARRRAGGKTGLVASIVTGPTSAPVIVLVATPLEAVALPVPVTVPVPAAWRR